MSHNINPIAMVYTTDNTYLMKCPITMQTDTHLSLLLSVAELQQIIDLHKPVRIVLSSPTLGLLPHICMAQSGTAMAIQTDTEQYIEMQFFIEEKKEPIQRRRDCKVILSLEGEVILMAPQSGICNGTIVDISATGLLFATETALEIGQEFFYDATESDIPVDFCAKVIRLQPNDECNQYGCILQGLSGIQEEQLRQYVFQAEAKRQRTQTPAQP